MEKLIKPTDAELAILQVLWTQGAVSVRTVNDILNAAKPADGKEIGYTTTLKLMQLMYEKGFLAREDGDGRGHLYRTLVRETDVQRQLLQRFVDATFRGSASRLVLELLGSHQPTDEELKEIKDLIQQMEQHEKRD